jgi:hypothetical protein
LCMTSCGDQQTELESVPTQAEVAIAPLEVDSLAINAKKALLAYPALTDANCEQFLLDWAKNRPDRRYKLSTSMGEIGLETFSDAPLHSANFQYKVKRGYYMPSEFVRIVPEFVVQGGNSEDTRAQEMRSSVQTGCIFAERWPWDARTRAIRINDRLPMIFTWWWVEGLRVQNSLVWSVKRASRTLKLKKSGMSGKAERHILTLNTPYLAKWFQVLKCWICWLKWIQMQAIGHCGVKNFAWKLWLT